MAAPLPLPVDLAHINAFLGVAEHGSLSAASRALGIIQPTLGRHVRAFEDAMGIEVFTRHTRGFALTEAGRKLLPAARAMQAAMHDLTRTAEAEAGDDTGTVRIASSVHVAHHVLPQIVAELREAAPGIDLIVDASDESENLAFREADIAIRMYRPTQLDLVTRHIADIPIGAFAAKKYLVRRGRPYSVGDLKRHDLVGFDRSPLIRNELARLGLSEGDVRFPVRCDNQTAYWELVCAGCGIGFTQVDTGRRDPRVAQLDVPFDMPKLPVWLTAHETVRRIPRVAVIWEHLANVLSARFGRY